MQKLYISRPAAVKLMKDPRLLPMDKREPVEEFEDFFFEADEEMQEAFSDPDKVMVKKAQLYVAS